MDSRSLIFVVIAACAGPNPSVQNATASQSPRPGATRVSMDIENRGGEGTIDIQMELRDTSGRVIHANETLEVQSKQTVHFEKDIATPPGSYTVTATAEYPD
jgi:hypothetical protein